jgi:hypothetical protein
LHQYNDFSFCVEYHICQTLVSYLLYMCMASSLISISRGMHFKAYPLGRSMFPTGISPFPESVKGCDVHNTNRVLLTLARAHSELESNVDVALTSLETCINPLDPPAFDNWYCPFAGVRMQAVAFPRFHTDHVARYRFIVQTEQFSK